MKQIIKQLAGKEDITCGIGKEIQVRGGNDIEITKLNATHLEGAILVDTLQDLINLDVSSLGNNPKVIVFNDTINNGVYTYDSLNNSWIKILHFENIISVNTIQDLINLDTSKLIENPVIYVLGYHTINDGGGGFFIYDKDKSKTEHDGGTIIDPDKEFPTNWGDTTELDTWFTPQSATSETEPVGSGCWVRIYRNIVPEVFGAIGDGISDDSYVLQKTLDFWKDKKETELILNKQYFIASPLDLIIGTDYQWSLGGYHGGVITGKGKLIGNGQPNLLTIMGVERLTIKNITFEGTGTEVGIVIDGSLFIQVIDNEFNNLQTGVLVLSNQDNHEINIISNRFTTKDVTGSVGILIESYDCYVFDNVIRGFQNGIIVNKPANIISRNHIYKYPSTYFDYCIVLNTVSNITLSNNYFDNPSAAFIKMTDSAFINIIDNIFLDNSNATGIQIASVNNTNIYGLKIKNNLFSSLGDSTSPTFISYPDETFMSSSKYVFIRDNSFTAVWTNKKVTSIKLKGLIPDGSTSTNFDLSNYLIGTDNLLYINAKVEDREDCHITYDVDNTTLTVYVDSAVSGDKNVYVEVTSAAETSF